jgi:pyruvate/2-oxoglutarate dehydrogenase complex dihydrolipoamide acyltransferase (E2) component
MAMEVVMPQMGQSVAEGTIIQWLKREGELVEKDEPLLTINTDKIDVEIPAPGTGILSRILVREGETVPVGTPLAHIEAADETAKVEVVPVREEGTGWYSPAVLELARQKGLDLPELQKIQGTGLEGRVTKKDILQYLGEGGRPEAPAEEIIPFSPMRRAIAEHMVRSKQTAPHATAMIEVDLSAIVEFRESAKVAFQERHGVPLTFLPFFIQATGAGLKRYPFLNASVERERIIVKREINIGIAVALQEGLIVPVLKGADGLDWVEITKRSHDLIQRARGKRLLPAEVQGGTFTVNNLGVSGILIATPIIVQPQVALLGIGAITKRPVAVGDTLTARHMAYLCLSFDHRVIDGALAGEFLGEVKTRLEGFIPPQG